MSVNDAVLNNRIHTGTKLIRFEATLQGGLKSKLNLLRDEFIKLLKDIDPTSPSRFIWQQQRLQTLLEEINKTADSAYSEISSYIDTNMKDLAKVSIDRAVSDINKALGVDILTSVGLKKDLTFDFVRSILIQGSPLSQFLDAQKGSVVNKFSNVVRQDVQDGASLSDMVRQVRGAKENNYEDGIFASTYKQGAALARTAVQSVNNQSSLYLYEQNTELIGSIQWVSTLDTRTSDICMALDGLEWSLPDYEPIGHDQTFPGPTAHVNCRSTQVPVLNKAKDIPAKVLKGLSEGTRASMDGQVAESQTYDSWLKTQDVSVQKEVLGQGRWELWNNGDISTRDLINQNNRPISLKDLSN